MRSIFIIYILTLFISVFIYANDTALSSYGGVLVPDKETSIELKREILEFNKANRGLFTSVYFEFFNPGEKVDLTVGFISPPIKDWEGKIQPLDIRDFEVYVNELKKEYSITQFDTSNSNFPEYFVFKFNVTFLPGMNKIEHNYIFDYAGNSAGIRWFNYVLKSGLFWGNSEIEDFKLIINLGDHIGFDIPYNFGIEDRKHYWRIDGVGKFDSTDHSDKRRVKHDGSPCFYAFIKKGKLIFEKKHFKPTKNLKVSLYDPVQHLKQIRIVSDNGITSENMTYLTNNDIRIARNTLFAKYGYKFKSKDLLDHFSKYFWYISDDSVPNDVSILSETEKKLFDKIIELQQYRNEEKTK